MTAELDPELQYLKARYASELRQALETTLADLSPREATVLRLYFLEGMTTFAIGSMYRVAERTARHWIATIRTKILDETRHRLGDRLNIPDGEIESLVRLLRDDLNPSILEVLDHPGK